jgi:hypothetical protein
VPGAPAPKRLDKQVIQANEAEKASNIVDNIYEKKRLQLEVQARPGERFRDIVYLTQYSHITESIPDILQKKNLANW